MVVVDKKGTITLGNLFLHVFDDDPFGTNSLPHIVNNHIWLF